MTPVRKYINAFTGLAVGTLLGFLLYTLLKAFIGSAWSVAEGGPWPIVYSPYIVLATVGTAVGFFTKIKKAIRQNCCTKCEEGSKGNTRKSKEN